MGAEVELVTPSHLFNKNVGLKEVLNEIDGKNYSPGDPKSPGELQWQSLGFLEGSLLK
jgi:hypothetical protein